MLQIVVIRRTFSNSKLCERTKRRNVKKRESHPFVLEVLLNLTRGLPEAFVFPNPNTGVPYSNTLLEVIFYGGKRSYGNQPVDVCSRQAQRIVTGWDGCVSPSNEPPLSQDPGLPFLSITADVVTPKVNPGCPRSRETFTDLVPDGIGRDKEEFFYSGIAFDDFSETSDCLIHLMTSWKTRV